MSNETAGSGTGTLDPVNTEYLEWKPEGAPFSIHVSPAVAEGIADSVIQSPEQEVGGLLLGHVTGGADGGVRIERYQQIACSHASGPAFILDDREIASLEAAAEKILASGELAVVGLYRSHGRPGFQLEQSDFDLIKRYFRDPSDLIFLIKANGDAGIAGQFYVHDEQDGARALNGEFRLRTSTNGTEDRSEAEPQPPQSGIPHKLAPERPRRLVPDFTLAPGPSPSQFGLYEPPRRILTEERTEQNDSGSGLKKWLPLVAALALVGAVLWFFGRYGGGKSLPGFAQPQTPEIARPLGLYVDPNGGQTWRISWNPNASALHDARNVQLFVHENSLPNSDDLAGDNQNRTLSARDLASGSYEYRPVGNDVTFRLEVTEQTGRVSAETFRLVRSTVTASGALPSPAPTIPPPTTETEHVVQPKAIYKAPAVVAAGIRSRITGTIPIDVRVQIDAHGRVVSATPVTRLHSGLDKYLAGRAVAAAKQWRFEPARENGKPMPGAQILHFVFEK